MDVLVYSCSILFAQAHIQQNLLSGPKLKNGLPTSTRSHRQKRCLCRQSQFARPSWLRRQWHGMHSMHRTVVTGTFSCSIAAVVDLALLQKWLIRPDLKHTNLCLSTASHAANCKDHRQASAGSQKQSCYRRGATWHYICDFHLVKALGPATALLVTSYTLQQPPLWHAGRVPRGGGGQEQASDVQGKFQKMPPRCIQPM